MLSVLCSTDAFTGLTTRHGWTASQRETWTAHALRQLLLQQPLSAGAKPVGSSQHVTPAQPPLFVWAETNWVFKSEERRHRGGLTPRELRTTFVSLLSHRGVSIVEIARLVGHASTRTTEIVYRRELRPVITTGAEIMDELFTGT